MNYIGSWLAENGSYLALVIGSGIVLILFFYGHVKDALIIKVLNFFFFFYIEEVSSTNDPQTLNPTLSGLVIISIGV